MTRGHHRFIADAQQRVPTGTYGNARGGNCETNANWSRRGWAPKRIRGTSGVMARDGWASVVIGGGGGELETQGAEAFAVSAGVGGGVRRVDAFDGVPEDAVEGVVVVEVGRVEAHGGEFFGPVQFLAVKLGDGLGRFGERDLVRRRRVGREVGCV